MTTTPKHQTTQTTSIGSSLTNLTPKTPPHTSKSATSAQLQSLSVEETIDALGSLYSQAEAIKALVDEHKEHLQSLYDLEQIPNKVTHNDITASLVSRTTWEYSPSCKDSIKKLQEYDKIEGTAKQKSSATWQIRVKPQSHG